MSKTVSEILQLVGGQLVGPLSSTPLAGVASLKEAGPGQVSFLSNPRYRKQVLTTQATLVFVAPDFDDCKPAPGQNFIRVQNPSLAFAKVTELFAPKPVAWPPGIHPTAVIHGSAKIGKDVSIQPHVVIEAGAQIGDRTVIGANTYIGHETRIGADCLIYPNVSIRERCLVGDRVILHCGVVIGSDGFGFDLEKDNPVKLPQAGIVQIDDDVEIGANCTVDRARFGRTWIQSGVKIDNLVMIAHNVIIKKNAVIVAQTGISGSSVVGEKAILAGQVGLVGHIEVGDRAVVTAQSGVAKDVPPGEIYSGSHARPLRERLQMEAASLRLPKLMKRINEIERTLKRLEKPK